MISSFGPNPIKKYTYLKYILSSVSYSAFFKGDTLLVSWCKSGPRDRANIDEITFIARTLRKNKFQIIILAERESRSCLAFSWFQFAIINLQNLRETLSPMAKGNDLLMCKAMSPREKSLLE